MQVVTTAQMKELERRTIQEGGVKGEVLMERAGESVALSARRLADLCGLGNPMILVVAGRGNNGGDAFVAARFLKQQHLDVEVWLAGSDDQVRGDALLALSKLKQAKVPFRELPTMDDWRAAMGDGFFPEIIIDGVLGTGLEGPARGPAAGAIQYIRSRADDALVLSIDIPSGLHSDTGIVEGEAVQADLTITMGLPKTGLMAPEAVDFVGALDVADIGIPPDFVKDVAEEAVPEFVYLGDIKPLFRRRPRATHKGNYGHVLVLGGSPGMSGAVSLASLAALRAGAGLVSVVTPDTIAPLVALHSPEIMVHGVEAGKNGSLTTATWAEVRHLVRDYNAVLVGPGLGRSQDTLHLVRSIVRDCDVPMVVDADALSVMSAQIDFFDKARVPIVLTPHPGEMATILGTEVAAVQKDRCGAARRAADQSNAVIVLKGAGTVIAQKAVPPHINLTGNPGMATAGTGDVLAGILVGLLAQGMKAFDAARAAVYLHGRAGDLVALRKAQASLIAGDLIAELPYAFREVSMR